MKLLRAARRRSAVRSTLIAAVTIASACSTIEKGPPRPSAARAARSFVIDAPSIMRGTIMAETAMLGYTPTVVRGYGLVVGLHGTGSQDIPPTLRAHMLAEMTRHGLGQETAGLGHLNPERMLNSLDTAVVIVEGVVPPGAVGRQARRGAKLKGTSFDVRVYAHPFTGTTSLENGRLYTTELRPVTPGQGLPPTGSRQARAVAEAGGPIFINPFAEPGAGDTVKGTVGRILHGGEVVEDAPIKLLLATPGHARAETIQNAINTRFPQQPGQLDPTARGESDETIRITVPTSFRNRPDDFVELLRHMTIRQSGTEAVAAAIKRGLLNQPRAAYDAAWRWESLGVRVLPVIKTLYDYPEEMPRLAALRAGSRLDDPLVIPHLIDMAERGSTDSRRQAVTLLGEMRMDPHIDQALHALHDDDDVDVRLAAYEASLKRGDPAIKRYDVDGKFVLDVVEAGSPMVYVTQVGRPRIAIFGRDLALETPLLVDAWNGRLLLKSGAVDRIEVYYRPLRADGRTIQEARPRLEDFVRFLGHRPTVDRPAPGIDLSYAETVGALYAIARQRGLKADFKFEQDRVLAAILRQRQGTPFRDRPEFGDPDFEHLRPEDGTPADATSGLPTAPPLAAPN